MQNQIIVAYHAKNDKQGWHEVCRGPIDSPIWSKQDRVWIDELLQQGDWVLTCGWNMYQILKGQEQCKH